MGVENVRTGHRVAVLRTWIVVVLLAGLPAAAIAQATTGTIRGVVRDQQGGVVPGVTVTVRQVDTNVVRTTVTGEQGEYLVTNLPTDNLVPLILALARAEALRRMAGKRAQSTQWAALNQKESISVNELMQMISEADNEAMRMRRQFKVRQMPAPASIG